MLLVRFKWNGYTRKNFFHFLTRKTIFWISYLFSFTPITWKGSAIKKDRIFSQWGATSFRLEGPIFRRETKQHNKLPTPFKVYSFPSGTNVSHTTQMCIMTLLVLFSNMWWYHFLVATQTVTGFCCTWCMTTFLFTSFTLSIWPHNFLAVHKLKVE